MHAIGPANLPVLSRHPVCVGTYSVRDALCNVTLRDVQRTTTHCKHSSSASIQYSTIQYNTIHFGVQYLRIWVRLDGRLDIRLRVLVAAALLYTSCVPAAIDPLVSQILPV